MKVIYEDPDSLNNSQSNPIMLDCMKGWRRRITNNPCQLISDDFDKQKRRLRLNPDASRPLTLIKAMDRLRKHYDELKKMEPK